VATAPAISVALCTYNGARYLEEQLRSILDQTLVPDEIVVSDDGSSDDTVAIAERVLAVAGKRVKVTVLRNLLPLGVVGNFAQALAACRGELVVLCDQDDVWHPDRVARAAEVLRARADLAFVHADARLVDGDGAPTGPLLLDALGVAPAERAEIHDGHGFAVLLRRNVVTGATMMVRRELIARAAPFPPSWVHDEWLAMVAAMTAGFDLVDAPLIDYRQHGGNQIGAARLTLGAGLAKLREPREERNARLVERGEELVAKARALGAAVPASVLHDVEQRLAHDRFRAALPRRRFARIRPVLREGMARYARYGRGRADMVRDIVQPAAPTSA
jgi:hypothetical protein